MTSVEAGEAVPTPGKRLPATVFARFGASTLRPGQLRGPNRRIAQRLFLFNVLPLSVAIVAGLVVPVFLWSYFGNIIQAHGDSRAFAESANSLRQAAMESELLRANYTIKPDPLLLPQVKDAPRKVRAASIDCERYLDNISDMPLRLSFTDASDAFNIWEAHARRLARGTKTPQAQEAEIISSWKPVEMRLDSFAQRTSEHVKELSDQAQVAHAMRRVTVLVVPTLALLLSVLIGRSIALGITRPLESLTLATEELEQGGTAALLADLEAAPPGQGDELSDLQHAFGRMARTIRQRETMLRAQNDALGALNQRVEAVLNATNDGILMLDRTGAFSVVNQQFALLFGIETEVLLDQSFAQAMSLLLAKFKNRASVRAALEHLMDDPEASADEIVEVIEPVARTLRLYSAPVRGETHEGEAPELLGRIFVFRDVTREMIVDRMKTEFVSTVSHELKTPLTAIKGYVDLMLSGQTGVLNPTQSEFLQMMQVSGERLNTLIGDLLDISRIESGRMEIRRELVDYISLVRQSVRMMQNEADARSITLEVTVTGDVNGNAPSVSGDADRITQVLMNLLSNGIKYTPVGGKVTVRVEFDSVEQVAATCVADTGIGIGPDDLSRLFTKFFRADNSTTRETGGTGLGLAITQALLEKMRGVIWVESTLGQGSQFWFTLPLASLSTPPRPPRLSTQLTGTAPLVLSIDGDRGALHRLGNSLGRQGWVSSTAATPSEALRRARKLGPDLITLDPLSPGWDGFALLSRLREDPATGATPVVLLSLRQTEGDGVARDTVFYLPQSAGRGTLQSTVAQMLRTYPAPRSAVEAEGVQTVIEVAAVAPERSQAELRRAVQGAVVKVQLTMAANYAEVDAALDNRVPQLLILDTRAAPSDGFGNWICQLRDHKPSSVRLPTLVLVESELAPYLSQQLPTAGSSPVPLHLIGDSLRNFLPVPLPAPPVPPPSEEQYPDAEELALEETSDTTYLIDEVTPLAKTAGRRKG